MTTPEFTSFDPNAHSWRLRDSDGLMYPVTQRDNQLGYPPEWKAVVILEQQVNPHKALQDLLRAHPDWLDSVCPPITGKLTLAQALIKGVPKRLEDRQVAGLLKHAPPLQRQALFEASLGAGRHLTADALWGKGARFSGPPSSDLMCQALLDPWHDWDAELKQGKASSGSRKAVWGGVDVQPAVCRQALMWLNRALDAGFDANASVSVEVNGTPLSLPVVLLAVWTSMKQSSLRDEAHSWNQAWINAAEAAGVDWGQVIVGGLFSDGTDQPLHATLKRHLLPAHMGDIERWHLKRVLPAPALGGNRPRL